MSRATCHSRPQSRRLTRRVPSKPARSLPSASRWMPVDSSGIATCLVTSRIVRSPTTMYALSSTSSIVVLRKTISG
nr:hypothetical protein DA06_15535 [Georgenia sp. SUBG003]